MADITQIPSAKVPLIYGGDVIMTTEWYRYFFNLYGFTGGGTGAIPTNKGGTGQIIYTDGQLLIGNSTTGSLDKATITGGAGINVTNGPGSIALSLGGSGVTPGNYGNASTVPQLTVNEYGIISAATNVSIAISATQIVSGIIDPARISGNYSGITGVGTITSGVWQGTSIGVPYGGTGLSSYTLGDMLYATGTTALSKLAIGANTYILASTGTAPQWVAPSTISIGTATNLAGGAANRIAYQTGISTTSFIVAPTIAGTYLNWSGSAFQWSSNPLGDVVGPASATDEAIARFDTTTGKLIQNSSATINDLGQLTLGTGSPFLTALLTIRADAGASVTPSISLDGYGASVYNLGFRRAGGTIASPTATTATAVTSILGATTGDGTTYANTSAIQSILEALATPTSQPTAFTFAVTPVGSTTRGEVLRLRSTGAVAFSGATNYGTSGQVLQSNGNAAPTWVTPTGGTVTSVSGTGTVNGITLTGTVTSTGSLTLGGTLGGIGNSQLTNSTISGVALGGSLFNLTAGTGVSFSAGTTYNGSTAITINATGTGGTVTSVAALTLGTTGTDLSSTVANSTTTPVITLNVPTASAANRGALSSTDWSTFNGKQAALVSGTNIKTVSGVSLLGSGDVGTIGTAYGGTGLTTFTANRIFYASSTSVIAQSAGLTFDGTNFATTGSATAASFIPTSSTVPTNGMYLSSANTLAWATNSTFRMSLDNTGTLSTSGALSANTTVTAATSLRANLALGSGAGIDTSSQTGIVIAPSGNALLITGSAYYLVSIAEVTATGLNGVYVLGNGSVSLLGGIGWVATTTTPGAGTFSIAFSGGNYRIYNGFTPAGTYTFKATVIRMS